MCVYIMHQLATKIKINSYEYKMLGAQHKIIKQ